MAYELTPPTDEERARGAKLMLAGGVPLALVALVLGGLVATNPTPLTGTPQRIAAVAGLVGAYALAVLLWGLRPVGKEWDCDAARRTGHATPWEGFFTMVSLVVAGTPVLIYLTSR